MSRQSCMTITVTYHIASVFATLLDEDFPHLEYRYGIKLYHWGQHELITCHHHMTSFFATLLDEDFSHF